MNSKLLRYSLLIVEMTSIPLLLLTLIYIITGYQMLTPLIVFARPRALHVDRLLRVLFVYLSLAHSYAGLIIMTTRKIRSKKALNFLLITLAAILTYFLAIFTLIELII